MLVAAVVDTQVYSLSIPRLHLRLCDGRYEAAARMRHPLPAKNLYHRCYGSLVQGGWSAAIHTYTLQIWICERSMPVQNYKHSVHAVRYKCASGQKESLQHSATFL